MNTGVVDLACTELTKPKKNNRIKHVRSISSFAITCIVRTPACKRDF